MTFGPDHYVPVLKIKRAEKDALRSLSPSISKRVTPLLEIVERKEDKSIDRHLQTAFRGLHAAVMSYPRYLLDAREIAPDGEQAADRVFQAAASLGVRFTPVTGLSRSVDVKAALAHQANGVGIRLTRDEFEGGLVPRELPAFLKANGLSHENVDLIVDLGAVDQMIAQGIEAMASAFLADVPDQTRWRTLTVSGCAFPLSMGGVERDSFELTERSEWLAWRDGLRANRSRLERLPTFSDCAVQHPTGVEGFDATIMAASASVRFTLSDSWLLIKGVSTRNVPPSEQFPKLATRLVYGHLSAHFPGAEHCIGCRGIKRAAGGASRLGSAGVWRFLGTVHHITRAVEEIAVLPAL